MKKTSTPKAKNTRKKSVSKPKAIGKKSPIKKTEKGFQNKNETSIPKLMMFSFLALPNEKLFVENPGKWSTTSTQEFSKKIQYLCLSLKKLGVKKGDKIAILSDSRSLQIIVDLAIISYGAISVPIFDNVSVKNLEYQIKHAQIKYCFSFGSEANRQTVQFVSVLKKIIVSDSLTQSQKKAYKRNQLIKIDSLFKEGEKELKKDAEAYNKLIEKIKINDLCAILYTSGTTGKPKGVMLSHHCFISQIQMVQKKVHLFSEKDRCVSFLPMSHIFERTVLYFYLSRGVSVYLVNDLKKIGDTLRYAKPTMMPSVPRLLEKVHQTIKAKSLTEKGIVGMLLRAAVMRAETKNPNEAKNWLDKLYDVVVYSKMRQNLGGNFRFMVSGGAALDISEEKFFNNIGIQIFQGYGLTETSPVISVNYFGKNKMGTVGQPLEGVEIKLGKNNELLVKTPSIMMGYYKEPKKTREVIDKSGWFHTGDQVKVDKNKYISIIQRLKEQFKTSSGKYISPIPIEHSLSKHPMIEHSMIIADNKKFVSALLFADPKMKANEKFEKEISDHVDKINQNLEIWERVLKYKLIYKTLSIQAGEITPKMNIIREAIAEKFKKEISSFYSK